MELISFLLLVIGFCFRGLNDEISHHFSKIKIGFIKNNPQFWDKNRSWLNKYKRNYTKDGEFTVDLKKERFPFSTTQLVCFTDGFHLLRLFENICISSAVSCLLAAGSLWISSFLSILITTVLIHILLVSAQAFIMYLI